MHMRGTRNISKWGLVLAPILFLTMGCSFGFGRHHHFPYPQNPYPKLRTVLVMPVLDDSLAQIPPRFDNEDQMKLHEGNVVASQLAQMAGFSKIIRPQEVLHQLKVKAIDYNNPIQLADFGRFNKAHVVLVVRIKDRSYYKPQRMSLTVQLFMVDRTTIDPQWDEWPIHLDHGVPLRQGRNDDDPHYLGSMEGTYNSQRKDVIADLRKWASDRGNFDANDQIYKYYLEAPDRYLEFCFVRTMIEYVKAIEKARKDKDR